MNSSIIKVVLFGMFLGLIAATSTMLISLIFYYGVIAIDVYLPSKFLTYSALVSLVVGIIIMMICYIYVLILVRQFIKQAVNLGGK